MPIVIVSGAIAPYTNRLYNAYGKKGEEQLHVLTCTKIEPHRQWNMPKAEHYKLESLHGLKYHISDTRNVYFNPAVIKRLYQLKPKLIITSGFSPTMMIAGFYAFITRTPIGVMTDGVIATDPGETSFLHRLMRKILIPLAKVGIGASPSSINFLQKYGLSDDKSFVVPIVTSWDAPKHLTSFEERPFDMLFCGALDDRKNPLFFAEVVKYCQKQKPDLKVRIVGDGVLREAMEQQLKGVDVQFDGFLQADQLPASYSSAKLFLFPSKEDAWGLVTNESLLSGTPVIISPFAASSIDLVKKFNVGVEVPLDAEKWGETVLSLLASKEKWSVFQDNRDEAIAWFSVPRSTEEFNKAIGSTQKKS